MACVNHPCPSARRARAFLSLRLQGDSLAARRSAGRFGPCQLREVVWLLKSRCGAGFALQLWTEPRGAQRAWPGMSAGRDRALVAPWEESYLHQGDPNCGATVLLSLPVGLCRHMGSSDPGSVAPLLGILAPISPSWPECLRQCCEQHGVLEWLALQERYRWCVPWAHSLRLPVTKDYQPGASTGIYSRFWKADPEIRCQQSCVSPAPSRFCPLAFLGSRECPPGLSPIFTCSSLPYCVCPDLPHWSTPVTALGPP